MEQDFGLFKYDSQFITLEEYISKQVENNKYSIYKNIMDDLEETDKPLFFDDISRYA